jgi:tetratricopeptide (TPR) repeat protein
VGLGRVHTLAGRHDQAEETYRKALKLQPQSAAALHGLGQSFATRKRWDEAVAILREASKGEPANTAIQYDLAVALVESGDTTAALPLFAACVGEAEAHYNAGLILQRSGQLAESEQQFRLALTRKPDLEQARYWLQTVQQQQTLPAVPPSAAIASSTAPSAGLPANPAGAVQPVGYQSPAPVIQPGVSVSAPVW